MQRVECRAVQPLHAATRWLHSCLWTLGLRLSNFTKRTTCASQKFNFSSTQWSTAPLTALPIPFAVRVHPPASEAVHLCHGVLHLPARDGWGSKRAAHTTTQASQRNAEALLVDSRVLRSLGCVSHMCATYCRDLAHIIRATGGLDVSL